MEFTCSLEHPIPGAICYLEDKKFLPALEACEGLNVLISQKLVEKIDSFPQHTFFVCKNPRAEFARRHNEIYKNFVAFSSMGTFQSLPAVSLGNGTCIGINTIIHPNVTIYNGTTIGNNCIINSGSVIGAEGFSSLVDENGVAHLIRNIGNVVIEDDVVIGANCAIDRATFDSTIIRHGVKTDNFVHIAHNCEIGANTRIAPMSCFGGSCKVGENVWVSIGCSIKEHTTIGDNAYLSMGSVVIKDVAPGAKVSGYYAIDSALWNRQCINTRKL